VGRTYRTIKLSYNTTETSIDVRLQNEEIEREDITTTRQTIDGTRYNFITGYKRIFTYEFDLANAAVYDFFKDAFNAFQDNKTVTLERELDDGTYESMDVIVRRPQYRDDSFGETDKTYSNVEAVLLEI